MNAEHKQPFVTTPIIQQACRLFYTNFSNMWTYPKYLQDLKVIITLLLRANLCEERFFSSKPTVIRKPDPQTSVPSSKKKKKNRSFLMNELFDCITKFEQRGKRNKLLVIGKLVDDLFREKTGKETEAMVVDPPSKVDVVHGRFIRK